MSNYLAIATTTAALYEVLISPVKDAVGSSATIEFKRPHGKGEPKEANPHVNVYLYQVTPNAAFRNCDLPTRRADGTLVKRPMAALDLHYLLSFHGKDEQLEPQRMLGAVASVLQAQPILSPQIIQSAITNNLFTSFLLNSDLANQVERVRFTPTTLSLEEFSKLWSAFFQVEYSLSVAYQASVVLIESDQTPPQEALPVQSRNVYVAPFTQPTITRVISKAGVGQPILPTSTLVIQGTQLLADLTTVRIGNTTVTPPVVTETAIVMPVPAGVQAGVLGLQVIQQLLLGTPGEPHPGYESNIVALVLQPIITSPSVNATQISLKVNPPVQSGQQVSLLLNQTTATPPNPPAAYTITLPTVTTSSNALVFPFPNDGISAGTYFVRIKIDGAESPLDLNPTDLNFGPTVTIP
jgi:uncharacterized protein DUF4255